MYWKHCCRLILGLVFCVSAILKLCSVEEFELYIFSLSVAGFGISSVAARILIVLELLTGLCLLARIYYREAVLSCALMLGGLTVFLLWRMSAGDNGNCHCFGEAVDLNPAESIAKNIILGVMLALCRDCRVPSGRCCLRYRWLCISFLLAVAAVNIVLPPDILLSLGRNPDDVVSEKLEERLGEEALSEGARVICFFSTGCEFCQKAMKKLSGIFSRNGLDYSCMHVFFMDTGDMEGKAAEFFATNAEGKIASYTILSPLDFIPVTNGAMPVIVLVKDGKAVKEYDYITLDESGIADFIRSVPYVQRQSPEHHIR